MTLLSAKNLKAVDKTGTSDPFVKFIVNGEQVHKSAVIKKELNPVWKNETFQVPIVSFFSVVFCIFFYPFFFNCYKTLDFSCYSEFQN